LTISRSSSKVKVVRAYPGFHFGVGVEFNSDNLPGWEPV